MNLELKAPRLGYVLFLAMICSRDRRLHASYGRYTLLWHTHEHKVDCKQSLCHCIPMRPITHQLNKWNCHSCPQQACCHARMGTMLHLHINVRQSLSRFYIYLFRNWCQRKYMEWHVWEYRLKYMWSKQQVYFMKQQCYCALSKSKI